MHCKEGKSHFFQFLRYARFVSPINSFRISKYQSHLVIKFPKFIEFGAYARDKIRLTLANDHPVLWSFCKRKRNICFQVYMYDGQFWGSSLLALSVSNGTCHQFVYARLHTTLLHLRLWPHNNICSTYDHETITSSLQWGISFLSENWT